MKCLPNSQCARSYRLSLIHHLLDLDKSWNIQVFWDGKKMRRIWALNPNVRKINMYILFLSKYIQVKNYKSINKYWVQFLAFKLKFWSRLFFLYFWDTLFYNFLKYCAFWIWPLVFLIISSKLLVTRLDLLDFFLFLNIIR